MKKLLAVVLCINVAMLAIYSWRKAPVDAARGAGGGVPPTGGNGDVNGDGARDISDAIYLLSFLFTGGPGPVACAQGVDLGAEVEALRIAAPDGSGRLSFGPGPTDDCSLGIDGPGGLRGLLLRDPRGIRVLTQSTAAEKPGAQLIFGPTDDCSLGIDPTGRMPGLTERDPVGFRLLGTGQEGCRLIFGPTMDCTVEVDPQGPAGLLLRDPRGIRILGVASPDGLPGAPLLLFGPTDDCSLGIDPAGKMPGLIERDPVGLRLLGRDQEGCRLIFGPTMDCTVEVSPQGPAGLLLRDPRGIRILGVASPDGGLSAPRLIFGPTDDCSLGIDPTERLQGLLLRDPRGIRILGGPIVAGAPGGSRILFGPTDDCSIGVSPQEPGLRFSDPRGFSFIGGPVTAAQFIETSSRRFKDDVKPIEDALAKVQKLKGVSFRWDEEHGGARDIGFIAEEVAEVLPEVVQWDEAGKSALGVSYGHVVAVAVEGIKSQQREIDELRSHNAALEKELGALKAQMAAIAAQVSDLTRVPAAPAGR